MNVDSLFRQNCVLVTLWGPLSAVKSDGTAQPRHQNIWHLGSVFVHWTHRLRSWTWTTRYETWCTGGTVSFGRFSHHVLPPPLLFDRNVPFVSDAFLSSTHVTSKCSFVLVSLQQFLWLIQRRSPKFTTLTSSVKPTPCFTCLKNSLVITLFLSSGRTIPCVAYFPSALLSFSEPVFRFSIVSSQFDSLGKSFASSVNRAKLPTWARIAKHLLQNMFSTFQWFTKTRRVCPKKEGNYGIHGKQTRHGFRQVRPTLSVSGSARWKESKTGRSFRAFFIEKWTLLHDLSFAERENTWSPKGCFDLNFPKLASGVRMKRKGKKYGKYRYLDS